MSLKRAFSPKSGLFLFIVGGCALAAFAAIGFLAYSQLYNQRLALNRNLGMTLSGQVASAMRLWVGAQVIETEILASSRIIKEYCANPDSPRHQLAARNFLRHAHEMQPHLSLVGILNMRPAGENVVALDERGNRKEIAHGQFMLDSIGGRSSGLGDASLSYVQAMDRGMPVFISEAKPSIVPGLGLLFTVTVPVRDDGGNITGAVCYAVQLEHFTKLFVSNFLLGDTGQMEILDDRGLYLGSHHEHKDLGPDAQQTGDALLPYLDKTKSSAFRFEFGGNAYEYAAAPMESPHPAASTWWVLFHISNAELYQGLLFARNLLIVCCLAGTALILLLAARARTAAARSLADEEAKRKEQYVNSSPGGVLLVAPAGDILDANPAVCAVFGYSKAELLARNITVLLPGAPFPPTEEMTRRTEEYPGLSSEARELSIACRVSPIENGQRIYFIRDQTELVARRRAEEELRAGLAASLKESEALRKKAEAANKAKSDFLANISHEIRTPLNAIVGFLQLFQPASLDDKLRDYVDKMSAAARSLSAIVNDLLDFSKIGTNRFALTPTAFNPREMLEILRSGVEPSCRAAGLAFSMKLDPTIPATVTGDAWAISRMLDSFLSNAVKFTHKGRVALSCSAAELGESACTLRFAVSDTGVGIGEEAKQLLFQSFYQADTTSTREYGGMGIGLAISQRLARMMGASIRIDSAPGEGTTVTLLCPVRLVKAAGAEKPETALRGKRVLLVEDNFINQQIATELLEAVEAKVTTADNGRIALSLLETDPDAFDAVLMDLQMPVMDGYTAAGEIRKRQRFDTLPIIAMTAHTHEEERRRCRECGMNAHLGKPVNITELYATLAGLLRGGMAEVRANQPAG